MKDFINKLIIKYYPPEKYRAYLHVIISALLVIGAYSLLDVFNIPNYVKMTGAIVFSAGIGYLKEVIDKMKTRDMDIPDLLCDTLGIIIGGTIVMWWKFF